MVNLTPDVVVIGAGTAGLNARRGAEKRGASALLIDPGPLGTTCARVGCMPSKLLIAASDAAHHANHSSIFGVYADVSIDGAAVLRRVRAERDRFVGFVLDDMHKLHEDELLLHGRGILVAPTTVQVQDGPTIEAKSVVLAVGTRPSLPPLWADVRDRILTNDHIFEMQTLPHRVLVVGTGVMGLELGQALHRLGVEVTIIGRSGRFSFLDDPMVVQTAFEVFGRELDIHPVATVDQVVRLEQGVQVEFTADNLTRIEVYDHIVMAAGRTTNLDRVGLEAIGIDPHTPIDADTLQLGDHPIFVAGDANGLHPLLHEAADDGQIAGANAATFPNLETPPRRTPLSIVFTDPQVARVGLHLDQCARDQIAIGEVNYGHQGRARVMNQHEGIVRIYGDRVSRQIIGAEMVGPRVEHTAHLLAWAVQSLMTVDIALTMPFYHPVIEEGIRTALRDLARSMR